MDFSLPPETDERYRLMMITSHREIDEWLSSKVLMRIVRTIPGGYGTVYCLERSAIGERFARKVFHGVGTHGTISVEEIANEVNVMLSLRQKFPHENIVEILRHGSLGEHTASYFIDMVYCDINLEEYIYGKTTSVLHLQDYAMSIQDKSISLFTCALMQQILSGLVFIHSLNKVHRDLKPKNILYSSQSGWWKIADFGIASDGATIQLRTTSGGRGTPGYRAPEVINEGLGFSKESDIWSLGCILFELCTGKPAFLSDFAAVNFKDLESILIPFVGGFDEDFKNVILEWLRVMLQRDHRRRPSAQSMAERIGDLVHMLAPSIAHDDVVSWVWSSNSLGTDGPPRNVLPRWEDLFAAGTFEEHTAALERYERVLATRQKLLGEHHPATLWSAVHLVWASLHRREYKQAETLLQEIGNDHESTSTISSRDRSGTSYARAWSYTGQGRLSDALEHYKEAHRIQNNLFGSDHPDTLFCQYTLTWARYFRDPSDEIRRTFEDILKKRRSSSGSNHRDTLTSLHGLGSFHLYEGNYDIALGWFKRAVDSRKRLHGMGSPQTVRSIVGLVRCQYRLEQSVFHELKDALMACKRVLGSDDPETVMLQELFDNVKAFGDGGGL